MNFKHFGWKKHAEAQVQAQAMHQEPQVSLPKPQFTLPDYSTIVDTFIQEYVELSRKHHSVMDVSKIYEKLISKAYIPLAKEEECMAFIAEATAKLFESLIFNEQYSKVINEQNMTFLKIEQEIIAALYVFTRDRDIDFATLFDFLYEETEHNETNFWSFDAFANLSTIAKNHFHYGDNEVENTIAQIWTKYLYGFIEFASEASMHQLADNELDDWEKILHERLNDENEHTVLLEYSLDVLIGAIPLAFPELIADAYKAALYISLEENDGSEMMHHFNEGILPSELLDEDTSMVVYLLRKMADYTKYQSIEFPIVKTLWKNILEEIMFRSDFGCELNEAEDLLIHVFGISEDEVKEYIFKSTYQMIGDMQHDSTDAYFLAKMLCNKCAFDVIEEYNPHFIDSFAL